MLAAFLAQWLERSAVNRKVAGSIPAGGGFFEVVTCRLGDFGNSRKRILIGYVLRWSSGYDARLTRERSPVQSRNEVTFVARSTTFE